MTIPLSWSEITKFLMLGWLWLAAVFFCALAVAFFQGCPFVLSHFNLIEGTPKTKEKRKKRTKKLKHCAGKILKFQKQSYWTLKGSEFENSPGCVSSLPTELYAALLLDVIYLLQCCLSLILKRWCRHSIFVLSLCWTLIYRKYRLLYFTLILCRIINSF